MSVICKNVPSLTYDNPILIGQGSFGQVFRVVDPDNKRTIVYKQITKNVSEKEGNKILNEVEILAYLTDICPNYVLNYIDCKQTPLDFYILTEYLGNYVHSTDYHFIALDDTKLLKVVNNLLKGLRSIHKCGVAHRDIKPENIMINPSTQEIKYIDFGGSCLLGGCDMTSNVGTPLYKAPELLLIPRPLDLDEVHTLETWQKTDYWALGLTIVEFALYQPFYFTVHKEMNEMRELTGLVQNNFVKDHNWIDDCLKKLIRYPRGETNVELLKKLRPIVVDLTNYYPDLRTFEKFII